jgi:multicomponent K+:H+ antiporter subunit G
VLLASMLWHWVHDAWALRELLITLFLFVTAPVSAHLMAQAALHLRAPSKAPPPADLDLS